MPGKKREESTLIQSDEGLKTVCGWLGVNYKAYLPSDGDFSAGPSVRPDRGGVGSENLSVTEVKKQTGGVHALGGLERKLNPKKVVKETAKRKQDTQDSDEENMKTSLQTSTHQTRRSELEIHAEIQRKKQRKKKRKMGTPTQKPSQPPKQQEILQGPDD